MNNLNKQKVHISLLVCIVAIYLTFLPTVRAQVVDYFKDTPHIPVSGSNGGGLNSENAPYVYPPGEAVKQSTEGMNKAGSSNQDCVSLDEYLNRPTNMGDFNQTVCDSDANSSGSDYSLGNGHGWITSLGQLITADTPVSTDLADLKSKLTPSTMLVRIPDDAQGRTRWAIVSKNDVGAWENYYSSMVTPDMNPYSDSSLMVFRIIGSALEESGLQGLVTNWRVGSNSEFVQASGSNYDSYNNIKDYSSSLQGLSEENIGKIFDYVQKTITPSDKADGYSMAQSLESGLGVCRHLSSVLANTLSDSGYNSSIVFDNTHAWVRVSINNKTFDLDPNNYSFVELPPRETSSKYQVIPIVPPSRPGSFLWPILIETAYASTDASMPIASSSGSTPAPVTKEVCGRIGICLDIPEPFYVQTNSSTTLEIWQAKDKSDWSIMTFFKNPDIKMDFSKVQSVTIDFLGKSAPAKEHVIKSNGYTTYALYSVSKDTEGNEIILQALSSKSILSNSALMSMISGKKSTDAAKPQPVVAESAAALGGVWPLMVAFVLALAGIVFGVIMAVRNSKKNNEALKHPEIVEHKKKVIFWYSIAIIFAIVLIYMSWIKIYIWQGTWDSSYGLMTLSQNSLNVSGPYEYRDGYLKSRISGFLPIGTFGSVLRGDWIEKIDNGKNESGRVELKISNDGRAFQGKWTSGTTTTEMTRTWTGTKKSEDGEYIRGYILILKTVL